MFDASGEPIHVGLSRTTDATEEWCSEAQAKLWLRVDHDAENDTVNALIKAARQKVETDTRRALVTQTWTMDLDTAPAFRAPIQLPVNPVISVTSVTSYSTADASSVVATTVYRVDTQSLPARLVLKDGQSWPSGLRPENAIAVIFVAGYGAYGDAAPEELRQAARLLMAHWHQNREAVLAGDVAVLTVPLAYEALVAPYKVAWH